MNTKSEKGHEHKEREKTMTCFLKKLQISKFKKYVYGLKAL